MQEDAKKRTHAHVRAQPTQNQLRLAQDQYSSPSPAPFKEPNSEIHLSAHTSTIPPVSLPLLFLGSVFWVVLGCVVLSSQKHTAHANQTHVVEMILSTDAALFRSIMP